jgi:hypothetical protein
MRLQETDIMLLLQPIKNTAMLKRLLSITLALCALQLSAQVKKTEDFNIVKPEYKKQSYYTYLKIIDSRKDTASYGIVQKGAFNKKALVQPKIPIAMQLDTVFNMLKSNAANTPNDTLVVQLRDLKFAERTEALKETGFFYLRAKAYAQKNGKYHEIANTDLAETVNAMDVTQKNYKNASRIINSFISDAMSTSQGSGQALTLEQVKSIEDIEKQSLPLYTAATLADGVYSGYNSFRDQVPNYRDFKVNRNKNGKIKDLEVKNHKGDYLPIFRKDMYAFVENGVPYIVTEYGYYPLAKKGNDYFYTGRVRVTADSGSVIAASAMFGIIGGLIASDNSDTYEIMIDHLNGTTVLQTKISN